MEVSGEFHDLAALTPGKNSWYPLDKRMRGTQNLSRESGEQKNTHRLPGRMVICKTTVFNIT